MDPIRHSQRSGKAAFTLTELLVVLLLIGIFTGIMLAEMRGTFQDALLRSSARDLMSGLSLASSRAVSLNQDFSFEWAPARNEFAVRPSRQSRTRSESEVETRKIDERVTVEIRDPSTSVEDESELEPRENSEAARDTIRFYTDGTADAREIVLREGENGQLVLRINAITGRVRVEEPN